MLEQLLQKMGIWFHIQNIVTDEDRITMALWYLEDGAATYMDDYSDRATRVFVTGPQSCFSSVSGVAMIEGHWRIVVSDKVQQYPF